MTLSCQTNSILYTTLSTPYSSLMTKLRNTSKPATHANTSVTPTSSCTQNPALPQGMCNASLLSNQQVDESSKWPCPRDTEALQGPQDASLLGYQCPQVDDPTMPQLLWDTETPSGSQDAGPSGIQHLWIEDLWMPTTSWDTMALQGPQDAGSSSNQCSGVDDTLWQPSCTYSMPASDSMPRHRPEIGIKALLMDLKASYKCRYGKLPATLVPPRMAERSAIMPMPTPHSHKKTT